MHGRRQLLRAGAGRAVTSSTVAFQIGDVRKQLAVFGDRAWQLGRAADPKPIAKLTLCWEHAFGGPDVAVTNDGESRVLLPNLEVRAERDISLSAGGGVRIESEERAVVRSRGSVELGSGNSELRLDGDRARLGATLLEMTVDRAGVKATEANLVVGTLRSVVHRLRERAEFVERTAGRVVERARDRSGSERAGSADRPRPPARSRSSAGP